MKKPVLWLMVWILCLSLFACAKENTNQMSAFNPHQYSAIVPMEENEAQLKHAGLISDSQTRFDMEIGLMNLSKAYFDPDRYGYKSHSFLSFDELDASDGSRGILGHQSDENPNGLNPSKDEMFDTGNGLAQSPILVVDVYELDFYQNDRLSGISLGYIVNDTAEVNGSDVAIAPEKMDAFLEESFTDLMKYMRERFNEISVSVPLFMAAYQLENEQDYLKGSFIKQAYFQGENVQFSKISQRTVLVPSQSFSLLDPEKASQFEAYQKDIEKVIPDLSYVLGQAVFEGEKCSQLTITIDSYGKSAGEALAVLQSARERLSLFSDTDCSYLVLISNNDELIGLIQREVGFSQPQIATTMNT